MVCMVLDLPNHYRTYVFLSILLIFQGLLILVCIFLFLELWISYYIPRSLLCAYIPRACGSVVSLEGFLYPNTRHFLYHVISNTCHFPLPVLDPNLLPFLVSAPSQD